MLFRIRAALRECQARAGQGMAEYLLILAPFSAISNHFRARRHRLTASTYRQFRTQAHTAWLDVTQAGVCH